MQGHILKGRKYIHKKMKYQIIFYQFYELLQLEATKTGQGWLWKKCSVVPASIVFCAHDNYLLCKLASILYTKTISTGFYHVISRSSLACLFESQFFLICFMVLSYPGSCTGFLDNPRCCLLFAHSLLQL